MNKSSSNGPAKVLDFRQSTEVEKRLIDYVAWFLHLEKEMVTPDSRLVEDLKIDGQVAIEFLIVFATRYGIDISGFNKAEYFHENNEVRSAGYLASIGRLFTGRKAVQRGLKELRIRDLARAVEQKKLPPAMN